MIPIDFTEPAALPAGVGFILDLCLRIIFGSHSNTLMPMQTATTSIRIKSMIKSATACVI